MKSLPLDFTLITPRLHLRRPDERDLPHVFSASRYPGFNDGMLWDPPATIDELRGPLERSQAAWLSADSYQFTIETGDHFVGRIALRPTKEEGVLDIGYWTHPDQQGKGYMKEAVIAILGLAFVEFGAEAVVAIYATWNVASERVLKATGFKVTHIIENGFVKGTTFCDEANAMITREEFLLLHRV